MSPQRIQRRRAKGWRMPDGAVYVGRPSRWGNPYRWPDPATAVQMFEDMLHRAPTSGPDDETIFETIRYQLRGKDLACWCPLDQPCHADVLLAIANMTLDGP